MNDYLEQFTAHLREQDRSPHTISAYAGDVAAFLAWVADQTDRELVPIQITVFDVQRYRDRLVADGRKPAGINRRLAALRAFFVWAVSGGVATTNPAAAVRGLGQAQRTPKSLSAQEVYRLQRTAAEQRQLAVAKADECVTPSVIAACRDEAMLNLLLYTGLRVGEATALRLSDVVLGERSGKVIVRSGKGCKYREVPLHTEARQSLIAYLKVRPTGEDDHLFQGQRGALGARGIQMQLAGIGEAAGVSVTPHVLRHTFGTRLLRDAGTDLVTVAALMGHASIATTAIYTQPGEADMVRAVEKLA